MNYAGYAAQPLPTHTPGTVPASQYGAASGYTQPQSPGYHTPNPPAFTAQPFSQHAATPYQRQSGYETAYNVSPNMQHPTPSFRTQAGSPYPPTIPTHQQHVPMVAPPMRWGFENPGNMGPYPGNQRAHAWGPRSFSSYGANKRDHSSAFGKPRSTVPRVPAAPPVPSFGNPLPSKPPPPADATARKPKKKKRKHNQLGLTPKAEEHESSEEEDDADEESKWAFGGNGPAMALQFTYRGKTSTLQTPADIAAWIEERKKRFPTQARVEEKKKATEDAKKAREDAARQRELQRQESKRQQKEAREKDGNIDQKESQEKPADPADAAAKAKQKAEKLRRKLMKEEKRVAKAEADAERARLEVEALQNGSTDNAKDMAADQVISQPGVNEKPTTGPNDLETEAQQIGIETQCRHSITTDSTPHLPSEEQANKNGTLDTHGDDTLTLSAAASEDSDWTSSSGSDLSSSDSEGSEDDSAPEEITSRREGPERVAPPPREVKKRICRHFARNGRCSRGESCKFLHEIPERGPKAKPQPAEKKGRKGLLQAVSFLVIVSPM